MVTACVLALVCWLMFLASSDKPSAETLAAAQAVNDLLQAELPMLGERAQAMQLRTPIAVSLLRQAMERGTEQERWRARLGLLPVARSLVPEAAQTMLGSDVEVAASMIPALSPYTTQLTSQLWQAFESDESVSRRLNAAMYLASAASDDPRWQNESLVDKLLMDLQTQPLSELKLHLKGLDYKRDVLLAALRRKIGLPLQPSQPLVSDDQHELFRVWELLVQNDPLGTIDLLLRCPHDQFDAILSRSLADDPQVVSILRTYAKQLSLGEKQSVANLKRSHLAALALLKLGYVEEYWSNWRSTVILVAFQFS